MELRRNVHINDISDLFENGSCRFVLNKSLGQILEKSYLHYRGNIFLSDAYETGSECLPK